MEFKIIVDTLASIASLIAIISVMISWYRSNRKPLKIRRIVVHRDDVLRDDVHSIFILVIENRQNYPVFITRSDCYKRKKFEVMKKNGKFPEYAEHLSTSEMLFTNSDQFEVPARAYTNLKIKVSGTHEVPKSLLFLLVTSHGYHELTCKDISVVDIGKVEVFGAEYKDEYNSKVAAKLAFYKKILKELISRLKRTRWKPRFVDNKRLAQLKNFIKRFWFKPPGPLA